MEGGYPHYDGDIFQELGDPEYDGLIHQGYDVDYESFDDEI